jgi:sugar-phosphatase
MCASIQCQAILFDLDGVLVDSHAVVERTWYRWIERHDLDVPDIIRRAHGRRSIETVREVAPQLNADEEVRWLADAELGDFDDIIAVAGASSILGALREGEWAVVTSGGRELARRRLEHANLPVPNILISAEDVAVGKPAPDGYLMAAKRLARDSSRCIVIEDTPAGIQAGRLAGARIIAISTTFPAFALTGADVILKDLADLALQRLESGLTVTIAHDRLRA